MNRFKKYLQLNRFSLPLWIGLITLLIIIPIFSWIQYQWLEKISETEKERLTQSLKVTSTKFKEDFEKDLSRIYSIFDMTYATNPRTNRTYLSDKLSVWNQTAQYPQIIQSVELGVFQNLKLEIVHSDSNVTNSNKSQTITDLETWLQSQLSHSKSNQMLKDGLLFLNGNFYLLIQPLLSENPSEPNRHHIVIVSFNMNYLRNDYFKLLEDQSFSQLTTETYHLFIRHSQSKTILWQSSQHEFPLDTTQFDLILGLGSLNMRDVFIFNFLSSGKLPEGKSFPMIKGQNMIISGNASTGVSSFNYSYSEFSDSLEKKKHEVKTLSTYSYETSIQTNKSNLTDIKIVIDTIKSKISGLPTLPPQISGHTMLSLPPFQLWVQHSSGSLNKAVNQLKNTNMLLSGGILLSLALSIIFLLITNRQVIQTNKQQMEFVAGITHEFRTPMAVIRSAAENINAGIVKDPEKSKIYGKLIRDEVARLTDMIEDALSFSGIVSGKRTWPFQLTDPSHLVESVFYDIHPLLEESKMTWSLKAELPLPEIFIDARAVKTAVRNLIQNAMKYSGNSTHIDIFVYAQLDKKHSKVFIDVQDYGIGISSEDQKKIFDPFYRSRVVTEQNIHGNGLGLALVKGIMEDNKGRVFLKSEVNKGSTFTLEFPVGQQGEMQT